MGFVSPGRCGRGLVCVSPVCMGSKGWKMLPGRRSRVVDMLGGCPRNPCRLWDIRLDVHRNWTTSGHTGPDIAAGSW